MDQGPTGRHPSHVMMEPEYRFCPKCGQALQSRVLKAIDRPRLVCSRCQFVFYLDPKVAVGAIATLEGRIVLLRRDIEPAYGKWVFPGGFVDRGETLEEACVRETKEEVNLEVEVETLLNAYSYPQCPVVIIVYVVRVIAGELEAADESLEVRTFSPEEIPWEELAFPSTRDALRDYAKQYLNQQRTPRKA